MKNARRARLVLVLLLLSALTLITLDYRSGRSSSLRGVGSEVFGPVENAASDVFRPVGSFFAGLGHLSSYKSENMALRTQVQQLRNTLAGEAATQRQLQELEQLDGLSNAGGFKIVPAHVTVVGDALGFQWTAAIDAGTSSGIRDGMTVIDGQGLVGKVESVSADTATVLLACDPQFYVATLIESSGERGSVHGEGLAGLRLTTLNPQIKVDPGQRLVTEGIPPFDAQLPVGTVTAVENGRTSEGQRIATVRPFVNFTTLDIVGVVVTTTKTVPRGALLPPSPSPSPTAPSNPAETGSAAATGSATPTPPVTTTTTSSP